MQDTLEILPTLQRKILLLRKKPHEDTNMIYYLLPCCDIISQGLDCQLPMLICRTYTHIELGNVR